MKSAVLPASPMPLFVAQEPCCAMGFGSRRRRKCGLLCRRWQHLRLEALYRVEAYRNSFSFPRWSRHKDWSLVSDCTRRQNCRLLWRLDLEQKVSRGHGWVCSELGHPATGFEKTQGPDGDAVHTWIRGGWIPTTARCQTRRRSALGPQLHRGDGLAHKDPLIKGSGRQESDQNKEIQKLQPGHPFGFFVKFQTVSC